MAYELRPGRKLARHRGALLTKAGGAVSYLKLLSPRS